MKIIIALFIAITLFTFSAGVVSAATDIEFDKYTEASADETATTKIYSIIGAIVDIARIIGAGVAIIILIVLGIKYIAASPEGKADIKKNATVYIVGVVILFAAVAILTIIKSFAERLN